MVRKLWIVFILSGIKAFGQVSPPGLDDTNIAFWSAIAVSQKVSDRWDVTVYVGESRQSDPDNFALLKKQAIYVINQETLFHFNRKLSLSFCASYRIQNRYRAKYPYKHADPEIKNEERYYLRFYFRESIGKTKLKFSFRPELRLYSSAHHRTWKPIDEQLRFRIKGQASIPLKQATSQFIIANEILSTTDHEKTPEGNQWSAYRFTEDRLTMFYRHAFSNVTADVGVMHQLKSDGQYIAHLAFDLILKNPFGRRR